MIMKLNLSGDSNEQQPFATQLKYTLYFAMVVFAAIWGMSDKKISRVSGYLQFRDGCHYTLVSEGLLVLTKVCLFSSMYFVKATGAFLALFPLVS